MRVRWKHREPSVEIESVSKKSICRAKKMYVCCDVEPVAVFLFIFDFHLSLCSTPPTYAEREWKPRKREFCAKTHTHIGLIDADEMCCWEVFRSKRDEKNKHGERSAKLLHGNMARAPNAKVAGVSVFAPPIIWQSGGRNSKLGAPRGPRGIDPKVHAETVP